MLSHYKYTDKEKKEIISSLTVLVDTREQKNEHILKYFDQKNVKYKIQKLDYGDYSFMIPENPELGIQRDLYFSDQIIVERKGCLEEISGNLTKERDRIKKELALAPKTKLILIEGARFEDMVNGNYDTKLNPKSFAGSLMSFWHKYNCPTIFMPDKKYSGLFIRIYFEYFLKEIFI